MTIKYITAIIKKSQYGQRLDQALTILVNKYSRSKIKNFILNGFVKINGQVVSIPKKKVSGDEVIEIKILTENMTTCKIQNIPINIVYEDEYLIIINKPSGLVMHPGAGRKDNTLLNALLYYLPSLKNIQRAGIIHRLDKDTTGLIIIAKTHLSQIRLINSLKKREIIREYEAISIGIIISGGTINEPILRHWKKRKKMTIHPMGKQAITHYRVIERFRAHTHIRIRLETGRTHQIRVHMAHIHHPILGDPVYGKNVFLPSKRISNFFKEKKCFNRQMLHSSFLSMSHPITSIKMEWKVPPPKDMVELINALKADKNKN